MKRQIVKFLNTIVLLILYRNQMGAADLPVAITRGWHTTQCRRLSAERNRRLGQSGRSEHYLADMNGVVTDNWPETAGRIRVMNHYRPLSDEDDLHEMGGDVITFALRTAFNPHAAQTQIDNMTVIGETT
jgi:hypothetical protein